jgi:hypothetical protein
LKLVKPTKMAFFYGNGAPRQMRTASDEEVYQYQQGYSNGYAKGSLEGQQQLFSDFRTTLHRIYPTTPDVVEYIMDAVSETIVASTMPTAPFFGETALHQATCDLPGLSGHDNRGHATASVSVQAPMNVTNIGYQQIQQNPVSFSFEQQPPSFVPSTAKMVATGPTPIKSKSLDAYERAGFRIDPPGAPRKSMKHARVSSPKTPTKFDMSKSADVLKSDDSVGSAANVKSEYVLTASGPPSSSTVQSLIESFNFSRSLDTGLTASQSSTKSSRPGPECIFKCGARINSRQQIFCSRCRDHVNNDGPQCSYKHSESNTRCKTTASLNLPRIGRDKVRDPRKLPFGYYHMYCPAHKDHEAKFNAKTDRY